MVSAQESVANQTRAQAQKSIIEAAAQLSASLDAKVAIHQELKSQRESQARKLERLLDQCDSAAQKLEKSAVSPEATMLQSKMEVFGRRICVLEEAEKLRVQHDMSLNK